MRFVSFTVHPRSHRGSRYVYPVHSRRSQGISIGLNLNPDAACNFDCVYCQVDRRVPRPKDPVDEAVLLEELRRSIDEVTSGALYEDERFADVPGAARRLTDLAFSGDGEPTAHPRFLQIVSQVSALKPWGVKLRLFTNATLLHRPEVARALDWFEPPEGEIWAKLDAGTPEHYRRIDRSRVPFPRILANLLRASVERPIVLQSLFLEFHGRPPDEEEITAWIDRISELLGAGGQIDRVQVYTIARKPAEPWVMPLPVSRLEQIALRLTERTALKAEVFG